MEAADAAKVLWIALTKGWHESPLRRELSGVIDLRVIQRDALICNEVRKNAPQLICFDFDRPDQQGLKALQQTKQRHPSLPVLMLTEYHSESLAIWAFRSRVWDYIVKPVRSQDLASLIQCIIGNLHHKEITRRITMPPPPMLAEFTSGKQGPKAKRTAPAAEYIREQYHEAITQRAAARLCRMQTYEFSRVFRQEHGITFQEFLLQHRIGRALKLLKDPCTAISTTAFAVGFNDLSNFSRTFRRYIGITPIQYKRKCLCR